MDPAMSIGFEIVGWVNAILGLIATVGYVIRIVTCTKNHRLKRGQVLLAAYAISSFTISLIFLLLVTGWYIYFAGSYFEFSIVYIRPFFTFLVVTYIISTVTHPDFKEAITKMREGLWKTFHNLTGRK